MSPPLSAPLRKTSKVCPAQLGRKGVFPAEGVVPRIPRGCAASSSLCARRLHATWAVMYSIFREEMNARQTGRTDGMLAEECCVLVAVHHLAMSSG